MRVRVSEDGRALDVFDNHPADEGVPVAKEPVPRPEDEHY